MHGMHRFWLIFSQPPVFKFAFTCHFRVNLLKVFKKAANEMINIPQMMLVVELIRQSTHESITEVENLILAKRSKWNFVVYNSSLKNLEGSQNMPSDFNAFYIFPERLDELTALIYLSIGREEKNSPELFTAVLLVSVLAAVSFC